MPTPRQSQKFYITRDPGSNNGPDTPQGNPFGFRRQPVFVPDDELMEQAHPFDADGRGVKPQTGDLRGASIIEKSDGQPQLLRGLAQSRLSQIRQCRGAAK